MESGTTVNDHSKTNESYACQQAGVDEAVPCLLLQDWLHCAAMEATQARAPRHGPWVRAAALSQMRKHHGSRNLMTSNNTPQLEMPLVGCDSQSLEHITSIELEAQSASVLKVSADRLATGTHIGKIKLMIGKESVILTQKQAGELGVKLVRFSY